MREGGKTEVIDELLRLGEDDPDVGAVLNVFQEVDLIYREALKAMGVARPVLSVASSAEVSISSGAAASSSAD